MGRCLLHGFFTHNARLRATHVSPSWHQPLRWHLRLRTIRWKTVLDATYSRKNLGNCGGARTVDADSSASLRHGRPPIRIQHFHLSCYDMHVVVNEEYVRCLRAAQSSVASCKRHTDAGVEQCRASSLHAKRVALRATRELHTGTQSALQQITEYEKKCINIHCRPSR